MSAEISSMIADSFVALLVGQWILLPVLISFLWIDPSRLPLAWNLRIQKSLLVLFALLPLALSLPFATQSHSQKIQAKQSTQLVPLQRPAPLKRPDPLTPIYSSTLPQAIPIETLSTARDISTNRHPKSTPATPENATIPAEVALGIKDVLQLLIRIFFIASAVGVSIFTIRVSLSWLFIRKLMRSSKRQTSVNGIKIYHCRDFSSSFSTGGFTPKVFLSSELDKNHSNYNLVLEHELNHIKLHHHRWSLAEQISRHLLWFHPFIHSFSFRGELIREIECDRHTAQNNDLIGYSRALLQSADTMNINKSKPDPGIHNWLHKKTLKRRITMLISPQIFQKKLVLIPIFFLASSLSIVFYSQWQNQEHYLEELALGHVKISYLRHLERHPKVSYDEIPKTLTQVLLRHEDQGFFEHEGISLQATSRAIYQNTLAWISGQRDFVSGGSTITQQLAKSFLQKQRSLTRKMREVKLARIIEEHYSKEEILEMYLNRVYFGNNAWGLASAAQVYFSKPYQDLTLKEAAMLIPFLEAPTKYNMIKNPELATARRDSLLAKLPQG